MLAGVVFFACLAGVYGLLYHMNHNTPLPEGCENIKAECKGCHDTACMNNPSHDH